MSIYIISLRIQFGMTSRTFNDISKLAGVDSSSLSDTGSDDSEEEEYQVKPPLIALDVTLSGARVRLR